MKAIAPTWYVQLAPLLSDDSSLTQLLAEVRSSSAERMKRELGILLEELSQNQVLILFFEDVQWADVSTVDLLAYLGGKCGRLRLLLVLTYRASELLVAKHPFLPLKQGLQGRGVCREVALDCLTRDDLERYLTLNFRGHRFPAEFAAMLHARTGGNPLFVIELLRYLRERTVLSEEQGGWHLAQSVPSLEHDLPESVRSIVQQKIDRLSEADRQLLVVASVQGHQFDSAVVAQVLPRDPAEVEERLEVLDKDHAFVRLVGEREFPDGTLSVRYGFVQGLYQNTLYGTLRPTRKAALSGAVARALRGFVGENIAGVAAELAFLFEAARDWPEAVPYYLTAAQGAARVYAYREAITLARRGLALLPKVPESPERARWELLLLNTLGASLAPSVGFSEPEVKQTYRRAKELCAQAQDIPEVFPVLVGVWVDHLGRDELTAARQLAEQLLLRANAAQEAALLVESHYALATSLYYLGEFEPALEHLEKAIALDDPRQIRSPIFDSFLDPGVGSRSFAALALWHLGYPEKSLKRMSVMPTLSRELPGPAAQILALFSIAILYALHRDIPRVEKYVEAVLALAREHGMAVWGNFSRTLHGWVLATTGRLEEGIAEMRLGLGSEYRGIGSWILHSRFQAMLADVLGKAGKAEEGLHLLRDASTVGAATGHYHLAELHRVKGELLLRSVQENPHHLETAEHARHEAEAYFRQAIEIARGQHAKAFELRAVMSLSRLMQNQGRREEARCLLAETYGWFTEGHQTLALQEARELLESLS
jgi:predicted ATPase